MHTEELTPVDSAIAPTTEPAVTDTSRSDTSAFAPAALTALTAALLAACGGGGGGGTSTAGGSGQIPAAPGFNNFPKASNDAEAARFLQQAQFSSTTSEIAGVKQGDYVAWLQKEFAKPIDQTAWDWMESRGYGVEADAAKYVYNNEIGEYAVWKQLMSAPDAMRKRVALALSEFFVVSFQSMEIDWRGYTIAAYWDILNKYAFGNFRNLLEEVTLSPAMGHYLNTRGNQKEDPTKGRVPDENYAREVMQLFTIGLNELNLDGTVKTSGGKGIDSYSANDVSELARVFTGYDFDRNTYGNFSGVFPGYPIFRREYARQRMAFDASKHSNLPVRCTAYINIPATATGPQSLNSIGWFV
jgi:uncharacterized protein (DUF1800 family)